MTKKNQNFEMFAGDSKSIVFTLTEASTAVNLSGATVKWIMKQTLYSETTNVSKTTTNGIAITDAAAGKFTVTLAPADTNLLAAGIYYHEAEVTDAQGNVSTIAIGKVTVNKNGV